MLTLRIKRTISDIDFPELQANAKSLQQCQNVKLFVIMVKAMMGGNKTGRKIKGIKPSFFWVKCKNLGGLFETDEYDSHDGIGDAI